MEWRSSCQLQNTSLSLSLSVYLPDLGSALCDQASIALRKLHLEFDDTWIMPGFGKRSVESSTPMFRFEWVSILPNNYWRNGTSPKNTLPKENSALGSGPSKTRA